MPAGRPRKPTAMHQLEGTYREYRGNPNEPQLPAQIPDAPAWIDDDPTTKALFDQVTHYIVDMNVGTRVDGVALSLLADQIALYIELRQAVRKEGVLQVSTGSRGQEITKPHAALGALNNALSNIHKLLREYGLTAASRANVSANSEASVDAFEDFIN